MPVPLSPSQLASQQAAVSLSIDENGAAYHDCRPISRLPVIDDATLFASLKASEGSAKLGAVCPPLSSSAAESASSAAQKHIARLEIQPSGLSPLSSRELGTCSTPCGSHYSSCQSIPNRNECESSKHPHKAHGTRIVTADPRQIERLAHPKIDHRSVVRTGQPNYGRLLNFTEEEERDRQRQQRSCRTSEECIVPAVERVPPARVQLQPPRKERQEPAAPPTVVLSAAKKAYYEKLSAPKKNPPVPVVGGGGGGGGAPALRSSSATFDRLAAPKKSVTPPSEDSTTLGERLLCSQASNPCALTQQRHDLYIQRLAQPKQRTPSNHCDPHAPQERAPPKRYYGGTTPIPAMPVVATSTALPSQHSDGRHSSRVPRASWETLAGTTEQRTSSTTASSSALSGRLNGCETELRQKSYIVSSEPTPSSTSALSVVKVEQPAVISPQSYFLTPAASSENSTQVQSAPAKRTGSKPPIVVRTRRFVPQSAEQDTGAADLSGCGEAKPGSTATVVPQPVEAVHKHPANSIVSAGLMATSPSLKDQKGRGDAISTKVLAPVTAAPVAVQAVKRASPSYSLMFLEANIPQSTMQSTSRISSAPTPAADLGMSASQRSDPLATSKAKTLDPSLTPAVVPFLHVEAPPQSSQTISATHSCATSRVSFPLTSAKMVSAGKGDNVDAPSEFPTKETCTAPLSAVGGEKGLHKAKRKKSPRGRPGAFQEADFVRRVGETSPEPRRPVAVKK